MALTELIAVELRSPHTLDSSPLSQLLSGMCVRQSSHSGYPVTLYADVSSPSVFYLISGWHDTAALERWRSDDKRQGWSSSLEPYIRFQSTLHLNMSFDTIPMRGQRILGVVCHRYDDETQDNESDDGDCDIPSVFVRSSEDEEFSVDWIGGGPEFGMDLNKFHQFIFFTEDVSEETIRRRLSAKDVLLMRRTSLPRPRLNPS